MGRAGIGLGLLAGLALSACAPAVPDSGARGPGFGDYNDPSSYRAARDAELNGTAPAGSTPVIPPSAAGTAGDPTLLAAAAALEEGEGGGGGGGGTAGPVLNNPRISDEQSFDAVSNRETIESDAERLRLQREAYVQVQPTAVPVRPTGGANIVAYALATRHPVGQQIHSRSPFTGQAAYDRNCARYASNDLAQEAFLAAGGPDRDRLRIDPDGDGYACGWNPAPFRRVAG